ncbi:unnamed protein product, partial [Mesorhabditis belari]|uniref:Uncharacterized protein n=1 Tax=Mesorhabditis belari TaxID=2138241 RepID=A0AAF3EH34_9BILA
MENLVHCGPNGYLINYGFHFCSRFYEYYQRFDPIGQTFIDCVRPGLLDYLKANILLNATSCAEIEQKAFASHSNVYTNCDFCQAFASNALAFSDVLWNRESDGSQMSNLNNNCLDNKQNLIII